MKITHIIPSLGLFFLAGASQVHCRSAEAASDEIWVAIRVADRGAGQGVGEYYGAIEKGRGSGSLIPATGMVKLDHAASMENGQVVPLSQLKQAGSEYGYGDVAYFRADSIVRIIILNDAFVKAHFLDQQKGG